jgi:hypothetical protein
MNQGRKHSFYLLWHRILTCQTKLRNVDMFSKSFNAFSLYKFEMLSMSSHLTGSLMDEALQEQDAILWACSRDK